MTPIIGIIMRKSLSQTGKNIGIVYDDIVSSVIKSGGIPVMIPNDNIYHYLDICAGFILQGGDDISDDNLKLLRVLIKQDIPTLGICLGMQEMAMIDGGNLYDITDHNGNILHEITINKDSLLYRMIGVSKTIVNSRHKSAVLSTDLFVSSISDDNIIESIEDEKLRFFIGLQWHPENMYDNDINSKKIFDYFIKVCNDYACE